MRKRIAAAGLTIVLMFGLIAGAGRQIAEESERDIKEFTAFFTTPGEEMHTDNEIQNLIARKIGAKCTEYWLNGQTVDEAAWDNMGKVKHTYLPQVIMSDDFESTWQEYMTQYENCHPEAFLAEMQRELERRISSAKHAIL
ncbi:MAG: hypothetical protein PUG70_01795 [Lachnospiraceae bacterium]|nr:hypothetical protein [Lachnospiraceae bacterium]MDY5521834.1 hypothetical protein [Agathobacter sp.]